MGKGSGGCSDRPSMVAEQAVPHLELDQFIRSTARRSFYVGYEVLESFAFGEEYSIVRHYNKLNNVYYCTNRLATARASESAYPLALLYGVWFENYDAIKQAIASLAQEKVRHRLGDIRYDNTSHPGYNVRLWRKADGWQIQMWEQNNHSSPPGKNALLIEEGPTRQAVIDTINRQLRQLYSAERL